MATGGKQRDGRAERERVRVYQARQEFHAGQARRRTRDNLIAGIGGGVLILAIVAGQTAYFIGRSRCSRARRRPRRRPAPRLPTRARLPPNPPIPARPPSATPSADSDALTAGRVLTALGDGFGPY